MPNTTLPGAYTDAQIALAEAVLAKIKDRIPPAFVTAATHRILCLIDAGVMDPADIALRIYRWLLWSGALQGVSMPQDGQSGLPPYLPPPGRSRRPRAS